VNKFKTHNNINSCSVSSRSRDTNFQNHGLEVLKSRSRLDSLKSWKMAMSRLYFLFLLWKYFSIQICQNQSEMLGNSNPKLQNVRKFIRLSIIQNLMLKYSYHFLESIWFQNSCVTSQHIQVSSQLDVFLKVSVSKHVGR